MLVIPVFDLMGGEVVHARRGERSAYRPLQSRLTPATDPVTVVEVVLGLAPFGTIYVADLDAIRERGNHNATLTEIAARFPTLTIWLDAGFSVPADLRAWSGARQVAVIGSESMASLDAYAAMRAAAPEIVLSLDTRGDQQLGPSQLFDTPALWPNRVIVMTLDRVGAGAGPSFERLQQAIARGTGRRVVAAGGVRNAHDLERLEAMGVYACLVASAIHDGSLDRALVSRAQAG